MVKIIVDVNEKDNEKIKVLKLAWNKERKGDVVAELIKEQLGKPKYTLKSFFGGR